MSDTKQIIETGQIIPAFRLPGADGMPYTPWIYKQRENLLLLFTRSTTSNETRGLLRAFADEYKSFREEECAILAITPDTLFVNLDTKIQLNIPFPILADPRNEVISRYTPWDKATNTAPAMIVLADRYGALYKQWAAELEANLPPVEEILADLRYMNSLCTP